MCVPFRLCRSSRKHGGRANICTTVFASLKQITKLKHGAQLRTILTCESHSVSEILIRTRCRFCYNMMLPIVVGGSFWFRSRHFWTHNSWYLCADNMFSIGPQMEINIHQWVCYWPWIDCRYGGRWFSPKWWWFASISMHQMSAYICHHRSPHEKPA